MNLSSTHPLANRSKTGQPSRRGLREEGKRFSSAGHRASVSLIRLVIALRFLLRRLWVGGGLDFRLLSPFWKIFPRQGIPTDVAIGTEGRIKWSHGYPLPSL